jgi:hypothetical protein
MPPVPAPAAAIAAGQPDLHLLDQGQRRNPVFTGRRAVFTLDLPCGDLRLMSRAARPQALGIAQDGRLLGFGILALTLVQGGHRTAIPLDHPALLVGFHGLESSGLCWTDGAALLPAALFAGPPGPAELHIDGVGLPRYADAPAAGTTLFTRFESLGDDCEFGLVQRHFDADPQDLLRWGSTDAARLVLGLCRRFDGLGDPAATRLQWHADVAEYRLHDPRYLSLHTWRSARIEDPAREAALHLSSCARLRLLRRKLLDDIAAARRIFVFKTSRGATAPDHVFALHAALRGIGPAPLLCVALATDPAGIGQVEQIGDGLYLGHIDRFSRTDIAYAAWHSICAATAALVDGHSA